MKGTPAKLTHALIISALLTVAADEVIVFEAEHTVDLKGVFEFVQDKECAGGAALEVREGMGTAYAEVQSRQVANIFPQVTFGNTTGEARYRFKVKKSGDYTCWVRALWSWHCSNSIWVHSHRRERIKVTDEVYDRWHWVKAPGRIHISAGEYSFQIENREDGVRFDQFCLALDPSYLPRGRMETNAKFTASDSAVLLMHGQMKTPLVLSNARTKGKVWLRNISSKPLSIQLSVESDPSISVRFSEDESTLKLPPNSGPRPIDFGVKAKSHEPLQKAQILFHASWGSGQKKQIPFPLHHGPDWSVTAPISGDYSASQKSLDRTGKIPLPSGLEKVKWRKLNKPDGFGPTGRIDFARLYPNRAACHAYARCQFEWPRDEEVSIRLRSDDQGTLWLNGKFVSAHTAVGPADRYSTTTKMRIRKGINHLLMRVDQKSAFWEAGIEIVD
ncbi:MAG: hypothetical protein QF473_15465 [Planctomycetota bacterium]|jgi:hypothetical protein|nr:hypothetical protein [Planctomycetota bacterium]